MNETSVPAELDGVRLDKVVAAVAGVSRSVARRWCEDGSVHVDGSLVAPSAAVAAGATISHPAPPTVAPLTPDDTVPFTVLYEDDDLAVVDKPAGVVVHPGAGRTAGTLAAGLLARWPRVQGVGPPGRWGLVHRLDRETSGALLVALTSDAHQLLTAALAERTIERVYQAGVRGRLAAETGTIDAPVGRDPRRPMRMAVDRRGRPARTHYRVLSDLAADDQRLEVRLETGRTHQIRVHLSRIGHPVIGDRLYGWSGAGWDDRIWLHAHRLGFTHPSTSAQMEIVAPLPADLASTLATGPAE